MSRRSRMFGHGRDYAIGAYASARDTPHDAIEIGPRRDHLRQGRRFFLRAWGRFFRRTAGQTHRLFGRTRHFKAERSQGDVGRQGGIFPYKPHALWTTCREPLRSARIGVARCMQRRIRHRDPIPPQWLRTSRPCLGLSSTPNTPRKDHRMLDRNRRHRRTSLMNTFRPFYMPIRFPCNHSVRGNPCTSPRR